MAADNVNTAQESLDRDPRHRDPEHYKTGHQEILMVEGMRCGSCAIAVEALLKKQPGVRDAAVNFAADVAMICWDREKPRLANLQQAVARLGYRLHDSVDPERSKFQAESVRKHLQRRLAVAVVFGMWSMMPALLIYLAPFGAAEPEVLWPLALASGLFAVPVVIYSGSHFYRVGWRTLIAGAPGLDSLIFLAVFSACIISTWQLFSGSHHVYFDAAVMLITFQLIARLLDTSVRRRASEIIRRYLQDVPELVTVKASDGKLETRLAKDVSAGERIFLQAGDQLALDGNVFRGHGQADLSMLTGEHLPQSLGPGDELLAGCQLVEGELELTVTAIIGQRRIDRLSRSISALLSRKTTLQRLTDRIARILLPVIVTAAALAVGLAFFQGVSAPEAAARGLAVMIISCPCALSLAIPLVITMGHANMVSRGIVLRDPAALEAAAKVGAIVFDKTGTLTTGVPSVNTITPAGQWTESSLLQLARDILRESTHPVAKGLAADTEFGLVAASDGTRESIAGAGTRWTNGMNTALAGQANWLCKQGVKVPSTEDTGMSVYLACNGLYAGKIGFKETLRPEAASTIDQLTRQGFTIYLLSGDTHNACLDFAERLGISPKHVISGYSPEQKHGFIETIEKQTDVVFVGDGLNDGLALAGARLGIAVGNAASVAGAAAAVYLTESIAKVPATLQLARRARKLMHQNLFWAVGYNAVVIPLAVIGWVQPVIAAIAMSLSSVCVLLNSLRMQKQVSGDDPNSRVSAVQ
ncbi:heavy metal translocating P-type ATPase [Marinobacter sp. LV10MA510-1]|uniref:heavy metal translocating P-type ATPase n=1 Tax=Marinobacter sp. LV10MA510-1 TaxID=1415567 RepID=UPI000BF3A520|nr:cation-translocating P-type ATPase [Marinobacter sp. LV10MA510-1]PFG08482.1 Cu2+-exporting ATPase/Cu+-exporting ATPase [Marinobacter sp. LV10MA510-1]